MVDALKIDYGSCKVDDIYGRYITNDHLHTLWDTWTNFFEVTQLGTSVQNRSIKCITIGSGPKKVLMWSQMHGNESTTTKAVLDSIHFIQTHKRIYDELTAKCTLKIIPILNPDGAHAYTRVNANAIDLNRDARNLSQPESNILRTLFTEFGPDYCFNLHDQRTIFNVGNTPKPATVSFLSPSCNKERTMTPSREVSMRIIAAMNRTLQTLIPGQVGRYDDGFNPNCVGDAFQMMDIPTILFESGHFPGDYERERTREFIFRALWTALQTIMDDTILNNTVQDYLAIPENNKQFYDIIIKNPSMVSPQFSPEDTIGMLFKEVLTGNTVSFEPYIEKVGILDGFFGHRTYDCKDPKDKDYINKSSLIKIIEGF